MLLFIVGSLKDKDNHTPNFSTHYPCFTWNNYICCCSWFETHGRSHYKFFHSPPFVHLKQLHILLLIVRNPRMITLRYFPLITSWSIETIRLFRIISIPSFCYFRPPDHMISMECKALDFRCQCTQQKLQSICTVLTFDPQLKKILTFSVKDRYQLNYFICIKDFNAETITSLKFNLFSFFICCCPHHERKTTCIYIFLISDRQWGNRTPVFIQPFPWRLHITTTYNLPHLRLWYADVVTVIA